MEQSLAQTLAEQYVERVNSVEDIEAANTWVKEESKDLDESVVVEAGELAAKMLIEKGVVPMSTPEEATQAPVEPSDDDTHPEATLVEGTTAPSENA